MTTALPPFAGFGPDAVAWFEGLERDNSKSYFEATRSQWETQVRDPLMLLLSELTAEFGGTVRMFRQNRDVRFSPDKSPYKSTTYGIIHERPDSAAALYAQVSARGLYVGTGYHELARDQLERFRAAIVSDETGPTLEAVVREIEAAGLTISGEMLKTVPRGYPRDHPRGGLLRYKSFIVGSILPADPVLTSRDAVIEHTVRAWRTAAPLNQWLDTNVGLSALSPEERWGRG
ncbi:MAG: DUF2461 domain-containing protein [Chloroflexaceae bacterium]|nr:DUF2461 domain-containing protein [Chloroflexaceae bacterium]